MTTNAGPSLPSRPERGLRIEGNRRRFVGRTAELGRFTSLLTAPRGRISPVLFVHGPGGIGKSSLLAVCAEAAAEAGRTTIRLDGYAVTPPTPDGFRSALADALTSTADADDSASDRAGQVDAAARVVDGTAPSAADELATIRRRLGDGRGWLLLIDTFELLAPIETWFRQRLLPELPPGLMIVIAGRRPPSDEWLAVSEAREVLRTIALRGLTPEETRQYLELEKVPTEQHDRLTALTHGQPLALALVVDAIRRADGGSGPALPDALTEDPDLVRALLNRLIDQAPNRRYLAALQVCGHARHVTEAMLRAVLDPTTGTGHGFGPELFGWLRAQSFIEETPAGLRCHDLVRDLLDADLRWRDPKQYQELRRRVRSYLVDRLRAREASPVVRRAMLADLLFLLRHQPMAGAHWDWALLGRGSVEPATTDEIPELIALTERQQGSEQARWVEHWLRRQRDAFLVFRDTEGELVGFAGYLTLTRADPADLEADPGTRAIWAEVQQYGPPRPGELVKAWRFLVDRRTTDERRLQASALLLGSYHAQDILLRPRTAWDFVATYTELDHWRDFFARMDFHHLPAAGYRIGDREYQVFGHDWRRIGIAEWIDLTAARELGEPADEPHRRGSELVLSREAFAAAVRDALRRMRRPTELAANPLTGSALVRKARYPDSAPLVTLNRLLGEAIGTLHADSRWVHLYRVLDRTFVNPASSRERAAESLGLSASTYDAYLEQGIEFVIDQLWQRELGAGSEQ